MTADGAAGQRSVGFLPNMPFRLETDFAPVIKLSTSYNVLVVNPSVPAKSVSDLVTLMKSQPDKLNFSSGGVGTPAHLIGEMFKLQTGTRATHIPTTSFPRPSPICSTAPTSSCSLRRCQLST